MQRKKTMQIMAENHVRHDEFMERLDEAVVEILIDMGFSEQDIDASLAYFDNINSDEVNSNEVQNDAG